MPNFVGHMRYNSIFACIIGLLGIYLWNIDIELALFMGFTIVMFAVFPDIDSPQSFSMRIAATMCCIFLCIGGVLFLRAVMPRMPDIVAFIISFGCSLSMRLLLPRVVSRLTPHRGIMHSIPMLGIVSFFAYSIAMLITDLSMVQAQFFAYAVALGYGMHLCVDCVDGLYKKYIRQQKRVRPFSAISLTGNTWVSTLLVYSILCIVIGIAVYISFISV